MRSAFSTVQDGAGEQRSHIGKAQAHKPVIVHGYLGAEDMNAIIESVPSEGLCIVSRANTLEEVAQLQDAVMGRRGWASRNGSNKQ